MTPSSRRHHWHLAFDRIQCRDCYAVQGVDDEGPCTGAVKIRPRATVTRQLEERA